MLGGSWARARSVALLASSAAVIGAILVIVSGTAAGAAARPSIIGSPVVGTVLTAHPPVGFDGLYRWESCDPAIANCADSLRHNDPNWTDLPAPPDPHQNSSYTVVSSDLGHFIRLLSHDNSLGGGTWVTSAPLGPVVGGLAPEHGVNVLARPVAGTVPVKRPGQGGFQPLGKGVSKVPVGSLIDTRGSRINIIAATGNLGDKTPDRSVDYYDGLFRIAQSGAVNSAAVAELAQKLACGSGKGKQAKASAAGPVAVTARKRRRRIWGSGSGSYATSGGGGTGSVRGTTWLTQDTCKGTLFRVAEGLGITVFDKGLKKKVELGPGQSYFARNR
jgi:hypothetical protein